jgi:putative ATP-dependent endonuclease of the OLD family
VGQFLFFWGEVYRMHAEYLRLKKFRSFAELEIPLFKDLTIFVGENNGGKSNAIDAIRLLTRPLSGRRDLYCEATDVRTGSAAREFELEIGYARLNPAQQGRFISAAADDTLERAVFGLKYQEDGKSFPIRPKNWAGRLRGRPEPGCDDMVRHVYLPPLRDAKRALASGNPTRIYALLNHFLAKENETAGDIESRLKRVSDDKILAKIDKAVDFGLSALTSGVRLQSSKLGFSPTEKLIDIARDLRFMLSDHGINPEDLRYSGHGYANLLYMATIAVELENVDDADLTIFLVEEPEAHLHPQLQAAVLCFLEDQAQKSRQVNAAPDMPAGEMQVVVATHSPNLASWVKAENIVSFRSAVLAAKSDFTPVESVSSTGPEKAEETNIRRESRCIPIRALGLNSSDQRKIDRYLDVTKSSLLFGGRVLLVEGIAEALLLPVIAKRFVFKDDDVSYRSFRAATFVPIDGVDFAPYVRLLLSKHCEVRLVDRLVVVTDGDKKAKDEQRVSRGQARKISLDDLAEGLDGKEFFRSFASTYSLESELVCAGNEALLKSVYLELHPKSEGNWDRANCGSEAERAEKIGELFESVRKGDFAQVLAERIENDCAFIVPKYLEDAIKEITR